MQAMGQNVTGDVNLVTGADCGEVLGGGYRANVGGSTSVTVNGNVGVLGGVYGGSYEGSVGGNTNVTIGSTCTVGSTGYGIVCGGSCGRGSVAGRTSVTVSGDVGSGVYGGNGPTTNEPNPLGAGNNQRYSQKTNEQVVYPAAKTMLLSLLAGCGQAPASASANAASAAKSAVQAQAYIDGSAVQDADISEEAVALDVMCLVTTSRLRSLCGSTPRQCRMRQRTSALRTTSTPATSLTALIQRRSRRT